MTLNAQLAASQAQQTALQAEIERATLAISAMKAEVDVGKRKVLEADERAAEREHVAEERANERIAEIEEELRTAETIRRKLHNEVQELKGQLDTLLTCFPADIDLGNIRVFARVRPALRELLFAGRIGELTKVSAHEASREELAMLAFSDERTDKETGSSQLSVTNWSESATGREREQVNNFTFDKVSLFTGTIG